MAPTVAIGAPNPGDVFVDATITGANTVNITNQIRNLVVFEDIKKPYTVIQVLLFDNQDILNNAEITQNAILSVAFGQIPGGPVYTGKFILSTVKIHRPADSFRTTYWSCQGYSPQMFSLPRVQKTYNEVPMTDVTGDLVNNFLPGRIKPLIIRAPARNMAGNQNMGWVVNNQQVFAAIRLAMQATASAVDQSSAYTLYENGNNLVLDTLENALRNPIANAGTYSQRNLGTSFLQDVATQQYQILTYRQDDRLDTTALTQVSSQQTTTYDMFNQNFGTSLQGIGSLMGLIPGMGSAISQIPYNSFRPPTYMQDVAPLRRLVAAQFDAQSLTVQVPLNPTLTVGNSMTINIVGAIGDIQQTPNSDWLSGTNLITETRHELTLRSLGKMQGTSTLRTTPPGVLNLQ